MRLISVLVTLLITVAGEAAPLRLGDDVVPRAQAVSLTIDPAQDSYRGTVVVDLDVRRPVTSFRFHAEEMTFDSFELRGPAGAVSATYQPGEESTIVVNVSAPLAIGKHTLTIEFTNEFDRRAVGLYKTVRAGTPFVFTQLQAIDARKAFPVWDEPAFKIPFQLTAKIPGSMSAVFNTPILSESTTDGWKTVVFAPTRPVPAYMLAIAVGDFEFTPIEGLGVPGRVVTVRGQAGLTAEAVRVTPPLLRAMEEYFGIPYPYEKLDLIAVPEFWPGAMENPGAITFADRILLIDPATATPSQRRSLVSITAHELAHMWFGDYVTMQWWDDFWLNESFADWMGDKIADQVFPGLGQDLAELQRIQNIMVGDARASAEPMRKRDRDPQDAIRTVGVAYNKGKGVLSMVEQWLGPEAFRRGVNRHLRANAWDNADADDLWAALAAEGQKKAPGVLASFVEQAGLPLITVERLSNRTFRVSQERFAPAGVTLKDQKWLVPVGLRYSTGVHTFLLERDSQIVRLPSDVEWIYPNADARGYYRWQIPVQEMTAIPTEALSPRERLEFVTDLAALFSAASISGDRYLDLLAGFARDDRPEIVASVVNAIGRLDLPFGTGPTAEPYAAWVRRVLRPALDRIGLQPRPDESPATTTLRAALIARLGAAGDEDVLAFARKSAAEYLADPRSIHSSLAATVVRLNASSGDAALFDEYRRHLDSAGTPVERSIWLSGVSGFDSPDIRAKALDYALSKLRANEILGMARALTESPESRDAVEAWMIANHDEIRQRIPPVFLGSLANFGSGCEPARVQRLREFFSDPARKAPAIDEEMQEVAAEVSECAALRQREAAAIESYLRQTR